MVVALAVAVPFTQGGVISVDFIYSGLGGENGGFSLPCSGDTTVAVGNVQNANGQIFTGQSGAWNALDIGGNNASMSSASSGLLLDGSGAPTTVQFLMGAAANPSATGYQWRNTYVVGLTGGGGQSLRLETAYLYDGVLTGPTYDWALIGLAPDSEYKLTMFGQGGGISNIANGVPGVLDADNDWDWTSVFSDSTGRIDGQFNGYQTPGLYGLQLEAVGSETDPTIPEPLTLALLALSAGGLGGYLRRRSA